VKTVMFPRSSLSIELFGRLIFINAKHWDVVFASVSFLAELAERLSITYDKCLINLDAIL